MLYDAKRWDRVTVEPLAEWQRILLQAADLIDHVGHAKTVYEIEGRFCAVGAISMAYSKGRCSNPPITPDIGKAWDALQRVVRGFHIPSWNDMPERTDYEVAAALREAAGINQ